MKTKERTKGKNAKKSDCIAFGSIERRMAWLTRYALLVSRRTVRIHGGAFPLCTHTYDVQCARAYIEKFGAEIENVQCQCTPFVDWENAFI